VQAAEPVGADAQVLGRRVEHLQMHTGVTEGREVTGLSSPQPKPSKLTVTRTPRRAASIRICLQFCADLVLEDDEGFQQDFTFRRTHGLEHPGKYSSPFSSNSTRLLPCQLYSTSTGAGSLTGGVGSGPRRFSPAAKLLIARSPPITVRGRKGVTRAGLSARAGDWPSDCVRRCGPGAAPASCRKAARRLAVVFGEDFAQAARLEQASARWRQSLKSPAMITGASPAVLPGDGPTA
jgi:hypothetical protein